MPERQIDGHKGTFGRVLNIAGSDYMPGAAYLSSTAALAVGCGYVVLNTTEKVISYIASRTSNLVFSARKDLDKQLDKADVILIGCGLSTKSSAKKLFKSTVKNISEKPLIIDADGLNILSEITNYQLPKNTILTPHPKEAAQLLGIRVEDVVANIETSAKELSKKYNCVTVLKTHNTIVCSKELEIYKNETGNSALAKAGSGDVLAGIIAGLLAQKCSPYYAAKLGVYLHGLCGNIASEIMSEYSVNAESLLDYIPEAIKKFL